MAGRDPKSSKLTSRMIRDRLMKELDRNVALRVEDDPDRSVYHSRVPCYETDPDRFTKRTCVH